MSEADRLREQAQICRRVALGFSERALVERMLAVARVYDEEADAADGAWSDESRTLPIASRLLRAMLGRRFAVS
jgi:hypothetical protein